MSSCQALSILMWCTKLKFETFWLARSFLDTRDGQWVYWSLLLVTLSDAWGLLCHWQRLI